MNPKLLVLALASLVAFAEAKSAYVIPSGKHNTTRAENAVKLALTLTSAGYVGVAPIFGYPNCDFSTSIDIAGQTVRLLLDTGSSNNAIAGSSCSQCTTDGVTTLYTDNSGQSTSTAVTTNYGDGSSWTAYLTTGISTNLSPAGSGTAATMTVDADIAVITTESSFFNTQCSSFHQGIMGLAYASLAESNSIPYPDSLVSAGMANAFGIQVCAIGTAYSAEQRIGNWYLGGFPSSQLASAMVFTPITTQSYYSISVSSMDMGSTAISVGSLASYNIIVDSGTTLLSLPTGTVYNAVIAAIKAANPLSFTGSYASQSSTMVSNIFSGSTYSSILASNIALSTSDSAVLYLVLPDATNSGSTVRVPIRPQDYIYVTQPDSNGYSNIELLIGDSGSTDFILGGAVHMNKIVYYDRANVRVGFGVAIDCTYSTDSYGDIVFPTATDIDVIAPSTSDGSGSTTASPTATPTKAASPTATPTKAASPTATPTKAANPSATPTKAANPSATPTEAANPSATPTKGSSPSATPTHAANVSPSNTPYAPVIVTWDGQYYTFALGQSDTVGPQATLAPKTGDAAHVSSTGALSLAISAALATVLYFSS